jgi:Glycosyl transferase family 2
LALETLIDQKGLVKDIRVVGNGWKPVNLPKSVRTLELPNIVGIPEGRNIGAAHVQGEYLFFYDDDAHLPASGILSDLIKEISVSSKIAIAQPRATDPRGLPSPRRWIPRLNVKNGGVGGEVIVF